MADGCAVVGGQNTALKQKVLELEEQLLAAEMERQEVKHNRQELLHDLDAGSDLRRVPGAESPEC